MTAIPLLSETLSGQYNTSVRRQEESSLETSYTADLAAEGKRTEQHVVSGCHFHGEMKCTTPAPSFNSRPTCSFFALTLEVSGEVGRC